METLFALIGSAALLLWGVRMIRTGVTRSYGAELRSVLNAVGERRLRAFAGGAVITMLLQSGMATALLISTFASRAAISGPIAIATIVGADVGSALVVQVFSQRVHWISPLCIAIGVIAFHASSRSRSRGTSRAILGVGLLLLALELIGRAAAPLAQSQGVAQLIGSVLSDPWLALLCTVLLTVLLHSSVAMVLMITAFVASGLIPSGAGLVMILGANIGSALLPMLSSFKAPVNVRRFLLANIMLRIAMTLLVFPLLDAYRQWAQTFGLEDGALVAASHLALNLLLAALALPWVDAIDRLMQRLLPDRTERGSLEVDILLDESALGSPSVALACASRQTLKIAELVQNMLRQTIEVLRTNDPDLKDRIELEDDVVDRQYEAIKLYLARLAREELDQVESSRSIEILSFTTNLEHIGDIIDKNLMELAAKKIREQASFSDAGMRELEEFHGCIAANMELALNVFVSGDLEMARRLLLQKAVIRDLERRSIEHHMERIAAGSSASLDTSSLHLDVLRDLKRINSHLTGVAYPILERAGELSATRLRTETK
ncbi:MAG: Na/Pi cotransporter family protein [Quisquiliibacterium sp.]